MTTEDVPAAPRSDLDYAIHLIMAGKKAPEFAARVQEGTRAITERIRREHGVLDIAVALVREGRDEE